MEAFMMVYRRYLASLYLKNVAMALLTFTSLFLLFDFFERIDNVLAEGASFSLILSYFSLKIPNIISLMLPVATLVATLFTVGLLGKNAELTALRAAGLSLKQLVAPFVLVGCGLTLMAYVLNETIVPWSARRATEIYNIDIRKKNESGSYSQQNVWWRSGESLFSIGIFDSRTKTLYDFTRIDLDDNHDISRRTDAKRVTWVNPSLGWTMHDVTTQSFAADQSPVSKRLTKAPLVLKETPEDFYEIRSDPDSMSHTELRQYIRRQRRQGLSAELLLPDLHHKLAFPVLMLLLPIAIFPFALTSTRTGSLAVGFVAGLLVCIAYYVGDSIFLSLGRAEVLPPIAAAWAANAIIFLFGRILLSGSDSPS